MINKLQTLREARRKGEAGFTIIEVLIVLAIAGLIMLIVFLAVPALQRNSRNTSRKNDVGRLGGAATEFVSNNNGKVPVSGDAAAIMNSAGNLSQYASGDFTVATGGTSALTDISKAELRTGVKCNTAAGKQGETIASGATSRNMAIVYMVEGSGSNTAVCQDV